MDILKSIDLNYNFAILGYAVVEQAVKDFRSDLEKIIFEWSWFSLLTYGTKENFIKDKRIKDKITDIKQIKKFVLTDYYEQLCPIVHKDVIFDQLEKIEKEILGDEIYLLN